MIPAHLVGTNSTLTPISAARRLATSISNPTSCPLLSFMAQGTKVDIPTLSTPRFMTCSMVLSAASLFSKSPARAGEIKQKIRKSVMADFSNDDLILIMPPFGV